jgi:hypothetical protein
MVGMSYVLKEEAQLAQVWSAQDQAEHERSRQDIADRFGRGRQRLEGLPPAPNRCGSGLSV